MKRSSILAHRGFWPQCGGQNSVEALVGALEAGFGLETDLRDLDGAIVVSHDPPRYEDQVPDITWLLGFARTHGHNGRLALNIKADGLQTKLRAAFDQTGLPQEQTFVFDMSVPDTKACQDAGFPTYTRISEYEQSPSLMDLATGVWVDCFEGHFPQVERAKEIIASGKRAALVSPELHGRDHRPLWDQIAAANLHTHPRFELCTDFPADAFERLGTATS